VREVDPDQAGRWKADEVQQVVVIYPNDRDEQVAHNIADYCGPERKDRRKVGSSGALSSSTMMVMITAITASENEPKRSIVVLCSCIASLRPCFLQDGIWSAGGHLGDRFVDDVHDRAEFRNHIDSCCQVTYIA
jgi:hypothetical protein